jgi:PAS domain S-box-containing protein
MSRAELIEELRREREHAKRPDLRRAVLELQIYREEVRQQNEELIRAQRELELSRDRYADLFDSAPVGYLTFDANGVVEEVNLTCARLLNREVSDILHRPFLHYVADAGLFVQHLTRCRLGNTLVVSELDLRGRDEELRPVEVRSHPVRRAGRVLYPTTLTDLSERRRAEAERQELRLEARVALEANAAKDRFLAILSHELRNPLAVISAGASVLSEAGLPSPLAAAVERIQRSTAAEARLIDDLLDASRLRQGRLHVERKPVDLHALIEDVVAGLSAGAPEHSPRVSLEASRHHVDGDSTRLGQVVSNLVRNAQEATAGGGEIQLSTSNPAPDRIRISVTDTGHGIEPDDLRRIFELFERGSGRPDGVGLGLGLPMCKGLVEAHQGRIEAASDGAGRGARFDVELPLLAASESLRDAVPIPEPTPVPLRILLVEDSPDLAEGLAAVLERRGFRVTIASCVRAAMASASEGFDVLISDLSLPDGTGYEIARQLARRGPLRAIALSGRGSDEDLRQCEEAGFQAHLLKPVEPRKLLRVLARVAKQSAA